MNFLRLRFLIPDFKLTIDSQFTRECGRESQVSTYISLYLTLSSNLYRLIPHIIFLLFCFLVNHESNRFIDDHVTEAERCPYVVLVDLSMKCIVLLLVDRWGGDDDQEGPDSLGVTLNVWGVVENCIQQQQSPHLFNNVVDHNMQIKNRLNSSHNKLLLT